MRKVISQAAKQKGGSNYDVFTEADIHIQDTVVYNLKQLYPQARLIGEEDEVQYEVDKPPYVYPD